MQTLIINGSPKPNGDTAALVGAFASHLNGDIKIISHFDNISPCIDCRHCWSNLGCTLDDEMQEVYAYLETCDNIVFASPIWFSSLSGPLLSLTSRIQAIWAAGHFQKKRLLHKEKQGVLILTGGQPETVDIPTQTALSIMRYFNIRRPSVERICSLDTNNIPAGQDEAALRRCQEVAAQLNAAQPGFHYTLSQ